MLFRMTGRQSNVVEDWTYGPARWLGAGLLAGAAVVGIFWSISARRVDAEQQAPVPVSAAVRAPHNSSQHEPAKQTSAQLPVPAQPQPIVTQLAPRTPEAAPAATPTSVSAVSVPPAVASPSKLLNLNTATFQDLEGLPGIGPSLAARIIDDHAKNGRFKHIDDLDRVKGIGPKLLERIRPFVTAE